VSSSDMNFNENYDKRFYGIYRGVVIDAQDPLKRNRLKVQVPQVTGAAVTNWAYPCLTTAGVANSFPNGVYGSFQSFVDQSAPADDTGTVMTLDVVDAANGVTIVDGSKIMVNQTGLYNIQWSGQFQNTNIQTQDISVWIRKGNDGGTGEDVVGSTGFISVPNKHGGVDGHTVAGWNYLINLQKNDYIQFYWLTDAHTNVTLQTYAAVTTPAAAIRPSTASLIVTVTPVSTPLSAAGNGVWVMYEGGDPNFPVWMGVFGAGGDVPTFLLSDSVMDGGSV